MKAAIHLIWLNTEGRNAPERKTAGGANFAFTHQQACDVFGTLCELSSKRPSAHACQMEEVCSEGELIEALDQLTETDGLYGRQSLVWLLLPECESYGTPHYLWPAPSGSLFLPRLILRYPLLWLLFHFRMPSAEKKARALLEPLYLENGNGGCSTSKRLGLILKLFFCFGRDVSSAGTIEQFQQGLRHWFDPLGFRGAMLELLKVRPTSDSASRNSPQPLTARESRRVFFAAIVEEEKTFALCTAYAAYRAGMGAMTVSSMALFDGPLAAVLTACSSAGDTIQGAEDPLNESGSAVVLRDINLQFSDSIGEPNLAMLEKWPARLWQVLEHSQRVIVRVVSTTAQPILSTPPSWPPWSHRSSRLGVDENADGSLTYLGLRKPLDSIFLAEGNGLEAIPFFKKLVSVTRGRRTQRPNEHANESPTVVKARQLTNSSLVGQGGGVISGKLDANGWLNHSAPRHLQSDLQYLDFVSSRLSASTQLDDIVLASLFQLVRLEILRGAGPLLLAGCLESIYRLEIQAEVLSPYFRDQSDLTPRIEELEACSDEISHHQVDIKGHLVRQILGKLKVIYASNGIFGAADRVQKELLCRPNIRLARRPRSITEVLLGVFFSPILCLLIWGALDAVLALLAWFTGVLSPRLQVETGGQLLSSSQPPPESFLVNFGYLAASGNLADNISASILINLIAMANVIMLAIFTTALFRWITRD